MEKLITFKEKDMNTIIRLLNGLSVTGVRNCRNISVIAQILESGIPAEIQEQKKEEGD